MLTGTRFSVRRSFTISATPVAGKNHCGVGQTEFNVECIVTTAELDRKGFVIDNGDYQKLAIDLLPIRTEKNHAPTIEDFWDDLDLDKKKDAAEVLLLSGYGAFQLHAGRLLAEAYPPTKNVRVIEVSCERFAGDLIEAIFDKMLSQGWSASSIVEIEVKMGPAGLDANAKVVWHNEGCC